MSLKGNHFDVLCFDFRESVELDREIAEKIITTEARILDCDPEDPECIQKIRERMRKMCMRCACLLVSDDDGEA